MDDVTYRSIRNLSIAVLLLAVACIANTALYWLSR